MKTNIIYSVFLLLVSFGLSAQVSLEREESVIQYLNAKCTNSDILFVDSSDDFTLDVIVNQSLPIPREYFEANILPLLNTEELNQDGFIMIRMRFKGGKTFYPV